MALEMLGDFEVFAFSSGDAAIKAAPASAPDLLLLDVMMPGMDGPQTLDELRDIPSYAGRPAVFFTAKASSEENKRLRSLGAKDVLAKPFDPEHLAAALNRIWNDANAD